MTPAPRSERDAGPADRDAVARKIVGATFAELIRDEHVWTVRLSGGWNLAVECEWRIRDGERVALALLDDGQRFGRAFAVDAVAEARALLGDRQVVGARIGPSGDFTIEFDGHRSFETFTGSSGYEAWALRRNAATVAVCVGGGDVRRIEPA